MKAYGTIRWWNISITWLASILYLWYFYVASKIVEREIQEAKRIYLNHELYYRLLVLF